MSYVNQVDIFLEAYSMFPDVIIIPRYILYSIDYKSQHIRTDLYHMMIYYSRFGKKNIITNSNIEF